MLKYSPNPRNEQEFFTTNCSNILNSFQTIYAATDWLVPRGRLCLCIKTESLTEICFCFLFANPKLFQHLGQTSKMWDAAEAFSSEQFKCSCSYARQQPRFSYQTSDVSTSFVGFTLPEAQSHILPSEKQDHSIKKYWCLNFSKLVGIIIICLYKSCKRLQPVQFCHLQQHLFRFLLQIVSFSCAFYFTKITRAVFHFLSPFSCSYLNLTVASMYACEL